jgi:carbonic anhydrase
MQIPGVDGLFQALQFHIHTSSEHTIDGKNFGAEMHILHKDVTEDRFAVLAFMLEPSAAENNDRFEMLLEECVENPLLEKVRSGGSGQTFALPTKKKVSEQMEVASVPTYASVLKKGLELAPVAVHSF